MEGGLGAAVAGVFQPGGVAGVGEQLHAQRQRALRAFGDDDARGVAAHAARYAQVLGDGFAQGGFAHGVAVAQRGGGGGLQCAVLRAAPGIHWKLR
ncbi:hypothetical protein D3C71_2067540 [compost metagenome]